MKAEDNPHRSTLFEAATRVLNEALSRAPADVKLELTRERRIELKRRAAERDGDEA